ncbi:hypothetical protein DDZ14_04365 [Maritimibacter sp. 55A14]|uniref:hypothetical protein n=1 Tax=Maritimibacter sp. 55A14 TaxID=2174844 RepID=UPI000D617F39|nr:hypothetical protein [Maritimibacter sp. 55A14]PWE33438.1 hypothetical protein DDZ14_04365 [Maritimibacter sp. 55A14]
MALPLAPIAGVALRYGTLALAAYALSRRVGRSATDQGAEDALDRVPEGICAHRPRDRRQANASARFRRVIRLGEDGPGLEIDATALGRIRLRRP